MQPLIVDRIGIALLGIMLGFLLGGTTADECNCNDPHIYRKGMQIEPADLPPTKKLGDIADDPIETVCTKGASTYSPPDHSDRWKWMEETVKEPERLTCLGGDAPVRVVGTGLCIGNNCVDTWGAAGKDYLLRWCEGSGSLTCTHTTWECPEVLADGEFNK